MLRSAPCALKAASILSCLLLSGCFGTLPGPFGGGEPEGPQTPPVWPGFETPPPGTVSLVPAGARLTVTLSGAGVQKFVCARDPKGQGMYWRFEQPQVALNDRSGRTVAHQMRDFRFAAVDGSQLSARIIRAAEPTRRDSVRDVLFETRHQGEEGLFSGMRWGERVGARGGVPLSACAPSQDGMRLNSRFTALYRFYR